MRYVLSILNVPMADEKTVGPVTVICFLGLELDSVDMVVRMPVSKIQEIVQKIQSILGKEKVTLRNMQSLIGMLNFASRVIVPGRPFCRRLINATCGLTQPSHHLRVNKGIKADLKMWLVFFQEFNGVSVFHDRFWVRNADVQLHTDASGRHGLGCYFKGKWCSAAWPEQWHTEGITSDITVLELFPILVALHIWGEDLKNKKILFHCDNQSVVQILNSMSSRSDNVMTLLRMITMLCMKRNMAIKAEHLPGTSNEISDALSRLQLGRFRALAPEAEPSPHQVPAHLWNAFKPEFQPY